MFQTRGWRSAVLSSVCARSILTGLLAVLLLDSVAEARQLGGFLDKAKKAAEKAVPLPGSSGAGGTGGDAEPGEGEVEAESETASDQPAGVEASATIDLSIPDWRVAEEFRAIEDSTEQYPAAARQLCYLIFTLIEGGKAADYQWQIDRLQDTLSRFADPPRVQPARARTRGSDGDSVDPDRPPLWQLKNRLPDRDASAALEFALYQASRRIMMLNRAIAAGQSPGITEASLAAASGDPLGPWVPTLGPITGFAESTTFLDLDGLRATLGSVAIADAMSSGKDPSKIKTNAAFGLGAIAETAGWPMFEAIDPSRALVYTHPRDKQGPSLSMLVGDASLLAYSISDVTPSNPKVFLEAIPADSKPSTTEIFTQDGLAMARSTVSYPDGDGWSVATLAGFTPHLMPPGIVKRVGGWEVTPVSAGGPNPQFQQLLSLISEPLARLIPQPVGLVYLILRPVDGLPESFPPLAVRSPDGVPLGTGPYSFELLSAYAQVHALDPDSSSDPFVQNRLLELATAGLLVDPLDPSNQARTLFVGKAEKAEQFALAMLCGAWSPDWEYVTVQVGDAEWEVPVKKLGTFKASTMDSMLEFGDKPLGEIFNIDEAGSNFMVLKYQRASGALRAFIESMNADTQAE